MRGVTFGLIVLMTGVVLLMITFGLLPGHSFAQLLRFWPVLIIILGIEMIARSRKYLGILRLLNLLLVIFVFATVISAGWGKEGCNFVSLGNAKLKSTEIYQELEEGVTSAQVKLEFGANNLNVEAGGEALLEGDVTYVWNEPILESKVENIDDTQKVQRLKVVMEAMKAGSWIRGFKDMAGGHKWSLKLTDKVPLYISIDAGASNLNLDLSELMIEMLDIDTGATKLEIKLGSRMSETHVNIDTGVSKIDIKIPEGTGVMVDVESGVAKHNLGKLGLIRKGDSYVSREFDTAANKLFLSVDMGVSRLKLEFY